MRTIKTGNWTVTFDDGARVVDLATTEWAMYGDETHKQRVIAMINRDIATGVAPPHLTTWGTAYFQAVSYAPPLAGYWLSYLSLCWYVAGHDDVSEQERIAIAERLQRRVLELLAMGAPIDRLRI